MQTQNITFGTLFFHDLKQSFNDHPVLNNVPKNQENIVVCVVLFCTVLAGQP